jgi:hypothetical protein
MEDLGASSSDEKTTSKQGASFNLLKSLEIATDDEAVVSTKPQVARFN